MESIRNPPAPKYKTSTGEAHLLSGLSRVKLLLSIWLWMEGGGMLTWWTGEHCHWYAPSQNRFEQRHCLLGYELHGINRSTKHG